MKMLFFYIIYHISLREKNMSTDIGPLTNSYTHVYNYETYVEPKTFAINTAYVAGDFFQYSYYIYTVITDIPGNNTLYPYALESQGIVKQIGDMEKDNEVEMIYYNDLCIWRKPYRLILLQDSVSAGGEHTVASSVRSYVTDDSGNRLSSGDIVYAGLPLHVYKCHVENTLWRDEGICFPSKRHNYFDYGTDPDMWEWEVPNGAQAHEHYYEIDLSAQRQEWARYDSIVNTSSVKTAVTKTYDLTSTAVANRYFYNGSKIDSAYVEIYNQNQYFNTDVIQCNITRSGRKLTLTFSRKDGGVFPVGTVYYRIYWIGYASAAGDTVIGNIFKTTATSGTSTPPSGITTSSYSANGYLGMWNFHAYDWETWLDRKGSGSHQGDYQWMSVQNSNNVNVYYQVYNQQGHTWETQARSFVGYFTIHNYKRTSVSTVYKWTNQSAPTSYSPHINKNCPDTISQSFETVLGAPTASTLVYSTDFTNSALYNVSILNGSFDVNRNPAGTLPNIARSLKPKGLIGSTTDYDEVTLSSSVSFNIGDSFEMGITIQDTAGLYLSYKSWGSEIPIESEDTTTTV